MKKRQVLSIPNILSFFRLILVGVIIHYFIQDKLLHALGVFVLANFTDALDGYIARKYDMITSLGKLLDPLADKLMLVTSLACMYLKGYFVFGILLFVLVKESFLILGSYILLKRDHTVVEANIFGKVTTGLFFISIILVFLHEYVNPIDTYAIYFSTLISFIAFIQYLYKYLFHPKEIAQITLQNSTDQQTNQE